MIEYRRGLRAAARGLLMGVLSDFEFLEAVAAVIENGLMRAWIEGAAKCGILPSEMTLEERMVLYGEINREIARVPGLTDYIKSEIGRKGRLQRVFFRLQMWENRYAEIVSLSQTYACADEKLEWVYGDTQHCSDCSKLHGRVYRASVWRKYGVLPQARELECRGYRCGCTLQPTSARVTPGRPPRLAGA